MVVAVVGEPAVEVLRTRVVVEHKRVVVVVEEQEGRLMTVFETKQVAAVASCLWVEEGPVLRLLMTVSEPGLAVLFEGSLLTAQSLMY